MTPTIGCILVVSLSMMMHDSILHISAARVAERLQLKQEKQQQSKKTLTEFFLNDYPQGSYLMLGSD